MKSVYHLSQKKLNQQSQFTAPFSPIKGMSHAHAETLKKEQYHTFNTQAKTDHLAPSGGQSTVGGSPDNWPTMWVRPDGQLEHRGKTNELLTDDLQF